MGEAMDRIAQPFAVWAAMTTVWFGWYAVMGGGGCAVPWWVRVGGFVFIGFGATTLHEWLAPTPTDTPEVDDGTTTAEEAP